MSRTLSEISYTENEQLTASFAKALAHPVRVQILKILSSQACCYSGNLAEMIPLAQSTISQHLKVLKESGLIQGEITPPKIKYCINQENWEEAKKIFCALFSD